jgi:asparagine synthase (glutamine-hydrolysing)
MEFHRLGINGVGSNAEQPFSFGDYVYMCNGEIYNYKELAKSNRITLREDCSDCEIIGHLLEKYPVKAIPNMLKGYYAVVIYDKASNFFYAFTDNLGVKPLYYGYDKDGFTIASELKCINTENAFKISPTMTLFRISQCFGLVAKIPGPSSLFVLDDEIADMNYQQILENGFIYKSLTKAVKTRLECMNSSIQFGCFLSGGLDSSIVCAILADLIKPRKLTTFSIGLSHSEDLKAAREMSKHIGSQHYEYIVSEEQMLEELGNTINCVESYDTTTIRAATPMFLLCKFIKRDFPDIKVMFSGELSDELSGSYKYFANCPDNIEHVEEVKKLITNVHNFDLLRADKTTASNGIEIRIPFADVDFINKYLSIDPSVMRFGPKCICKIEKELLRQSFSHMLPHNIAWRSKMAFSDGVSSASNPWYKMIKAHIKSLKITFSKCEYLNPKNEETAYYRYVFDKMFPGRHTVVSEYWMPNLVWCPGAKDPSALTL